MIKEYSEEELSQALKAFDAFKLWWTSGDDKKVRETLAEISHIFGVCFHTHEDCAYWKEVINAEDGEPQIKKQLSLVQEALTTLIKDRERAARIDELERIFNPNPHKGGYIGSTRDDGHACTVEDRLTTLSAPQVKEEK